MWIDPTDGRNIINGNDGGVYISRDRGEIVALRVEPAASASTITSRSTTTCPTTSTAACRTTARGRGPSEVWENGGIRNYHWHEVGFGDGFDTRPDARRHACAATR